MTTAAAPRWESMRTDETRMIEDALRRAGFDRVDAYRYNPAFIRLRVVDTRFEALRTEQRDALVEPHLDVLPDEVQTDITTLLTIAPSELNRHGLHAYRDWFLNVEFEDPSPSVL